jgi:hypothetical protein
MRARKNGSARCSATSTTTAAPASVSSNPPATHFAHLCLRQNDLRTSAKPASQLASIVAGFRRPHFLNAWQMP